VTQTYRPEVDSQPLFVLASLEVIKDFSSLHLFKFAQSLDLNNDRVVTKDINPIKRDLRNLCNLRIFLLCGPQGFSESREVARRILCDQGPIVADVFRLARLGMMLVDLPKKWRNSFEYRF
jgi:hypothetical protein